MCWAGAAWLQLPLPTQSTTVGPGGGGAEKYPSSYSCTGSSPVGKLCALARVGWVGVGRSTVLAAVGKAWPHAEHCRGSCGPDQINFWMPPMGRIWPTSHIFPSSEPKCVLLPSYLSGILRVKLKR